MTERAYKKNCSQERKGYHCTYPILVIVVFLFSIFQSFGQAVPDINVATDTTDIRIGEQLEYTLQVAVDSANRVIFPEGQTFTPLEMVEASLVDTVRNDKKFILTREYTLTQFDSGRYVIPPQQVFVSQQSFVTDSLTVEVRNIQVDTTKQGLYDIKPKIEVEYKKTTDWTYYLGFLLFQFLLGILIVYLILRKRNTKLDESQLPPYERALNVLKQLDQKVLVENEDYKSYYSNLADTVRQYLNSEVYDHAMESTTDQLVSHLRRLRKRNKLRLDKQTIAELAAVLQTADLAKFAKLRTDKDTAESHRQNMIDFVQKTREAIPQPTEEELLADKNYQQELESKRKNKQVLLAVGAAMFVLFAVATYFGVTKGIDTAQELILGHPTKALIEEDWIRSSYGTPPVTVSTPKVLTRNSTAQTTQEGPKPEMFLYSSLISQFHINVATLSVPSDQKQEVKLDQIADFAVSQMENNGVKNLMTKTEEFTTANNKKGLKVFGSGKFPKLSSKGKGGSYYQGEYVVITLEAGNGFAVVTISWKDDDTYGKQITDRILKSIEI